MPVLLAWELVEGMGSGGGLLLQFGGLASEGRRTRVNAHRLSTSHGHGKRQAENARSQRV